MKRCILILSICATGMLYTGNVKGTENADSTFQQYVQNIILGTSSTTLVKQANLFNQFYKENNFSTRWFVAANDTAIRATLKNMLRNADLYALSASSYAALLTEERLPITRADTFRLEVLYTDAALSLMHDMAYGGDQVFVKYNGLKYHPDTIAIATLLNSGLSAGSLINTITSVEPKTEKYNRLKTTYLNLLMLLKQQNFQEIHVRKKELAGTNTDLVAKLQQLHYLQDDTIKTLLTRAVNQLQKEHGLTVQPVINDACLEVLNETIAHKMMELKWNIAWYRWMNGMADKKFLWVNIPSNMLYLYDSGKVMLQSKIVVGKQSTPTPTLTSEIRRVVYYPYWNVPPSIAIGEMLPALKRNPGYVYANRLEVLQNGARVNPSSINWNNYSSGNFPFLLRQKTGCKNALGRIKFEFENPFHVYLHDTNAKGAFTASKRYFSHGCMRVQKPYDLAVALGVLPRQIDMSQCLENKSPELITLPQPIPVFVTYITIDVVDGDIIWHEDAYRKMKDYL
jgi:L,D-transpeptidase YcbB